MKMGFQLNSGDLLRLEYDPVKGKFTIGKDNYNCVEMDIEKGRKYAFCAYLSGVTDQV